MSKHSDLTSESIHSPFRWIVADNTARLALTVTVDDLTKVCLVEDDDGSGNAGVYVLTAVTPTWKKIGNPGTAESLIEAGVGLNSIILKGVGNTSAGDYGISGGYNSQAAGVNSVAIGDYAYASASDSAVIGGLDGTASGPRSIVLGGDGGIASGETAGVLAGGSNQANGDGSVALGGNGNIADGDNSAAMGQGSKTRVRSQFGLSSGFFSANGDSQVSIYNLRRSVTHSDASWYQLYLDGAAELLTIPADTLFTFTILISGITSATAKSFSFKIEGAIKNAGGTTTLLASTVTTIYDADDVSFDARVTADDTNDALLIELQDSDGASDVVDWSAFVLMSEVTKA